LEASRRVNWDRQAEVMSIVLPPESNITFCNDAPSATYLEHATRREHEDPFARASVESNGLERTTVEKLDRSIHRS